MMNCNEMERKILLSGSGELSEAEEATLNEHVAGCAQCRAYQLDSVGIVKKVSDLLPAEEPSAATVASIISAAEEKISRGKIIQFPLHTLQLAACAAVLVLVAGGVLMLPGGGQADRIDEMNAIIAVVSDSQEEMTEEDALYDLADQLLQLQGFMDDDSIETEYPDEEQLPTALRLRSTRELLSKKCV
jgi:hypothetical protein